MNRKLLILPALAAAALFLGWRWWRGQGAPPEYWGTVEARVVRPGSLAGGRVTRVAAREGELVKRGQLLVLLDDQPLALQVKQQEARVAQMRAQLGRTATGPRDEDRRKAQIALNAAETDLRRQDALLKNGLGSQQAYDAAAVRAAQAREDYLAALRGGRSEDVSAARAGLAAEEARLEDLVRLQRETAILAPCDCRVEVLDLRPGDLLPAGQPAARLLDPADLWVRVYVPEPRLAPLKVGGAARVFLDELPERSFQGAVASIASEGEYTPRNVQTESQRADLVFAVKLTLVPDDALKPGIAARVEFDAR